MGVYCDIKLPPDVRVEDAATVMGLLLGRRAIQQSFQGTDGLCTYVRAEGVSVEPCGPSLPACAYIRIPEPNIAGHPILQMWHFECKGGHRGMLPDSTAWAIAVGCRLAQFFGGEVYFQGCDNDAPDYAEPHPAWDNDPEDGQEWQDHKNRIAAVQPITPKELAECEKLAAYSSTGVRS